MAFPGVSTGPLDFAGSSSASTAGLFEQSTGGRRAISISQGLDTKDLIVIGVAILIGLAIIKRFA